MEGHVQTEHLSSGYLSKQNESGFPDDPQWTLSMKQQVNFQYENHYNIGIIIAIQPHLSWLLQYVHPKSSLLHEIIHPCI